MRQVLLVTLFAFFISSATQAQFTVIPQNAYCQGFCTGTAQVSHNNGTYHYQWSNGDTSSISFGLCAGAYSVTVYDSAYNALTTLPFTIAEPAPLVVNGTTNDVSCFGATNGVITANVNGGTPPYAYAWSPNSSNTPIILGLSIGAYTLTVTDANGCSVGGVYTISEPPLLVVTLTHVDATTCSQCDGGISLMSSGGVGSYTYTWSNASTSQNLSNLCQGAYTCTVTDANACNATGTDYISAPSNGLTATATTTGIDCGQADSTTLVVSSGVAPYTVYWGNGGAPQPGNSPFVYSYPGIGPYSIIVMDAAGCNFHLTNTVVNHGISASLTLYQQLTCNLPNSGKLRVNVFNGAPPYFYLWSTGATADSIVNLSTGHYAVTVTDSLGCTTTASTNVSAGSGFWTYAYGNAASCDSGGLGSATIWANGINLPYTYLWGTTPPQTTQTATHIAPGNCGYTVTDNGGCSVASTANIAFTSSNFYVYLTTDSFPNCGNNSGALTAHAVSGALPYIYHWDDNQTTISDIHLAPGNHSVTVTDGGGCVAYGSAYLQNSCFNTITGNIFNDVNGNCVMDNGDAPVYWATVSADNGTQIYYGYTDAAGNYSIHVNDVGSFIVHATLSYGYQTCGNITPCGSATLPVNFSGYNNTTSNINFGFASSSGFDLYLHPGWTSANPGFAKDYWVYYGNQSAQSFTGAATVTFQYDANLVYLSSDPPLPTHNAATHTLSWNVNSVGNWDFRGKCHFTVPSSFPAGADLQSDFWIAPTAGDCDSSNNHMHFSELVNSSMDPNEKEVSPAGNITEEDSVLTYTVRFQNTGTDTTAFVILKDTLSHNLDPASVVNLASSHAYSEFTISGKGILTWVFNPIFLVDSATNESASKGFVTFSIKKKKNLLIGSTIRNKADIYFDYNQPVVTNTVADTVADPLSIFRVSANSNVSVVAFPNPFSETTYITISGWNQKFDFTLFDLTGRVKKSLPALETNLFEMKRDDLAAGLYFYKINSGKQQVAFGKLVVQ